MNNPLPGLPLVETPLLLTMADELGLSEEERRMACDLLEHGFAVFDFPDPEMPVIRTTRTGPSGGCE
jgi:hypothetical protein